MSVIEQFLIVDMNVANDHYEDFESEYNVEEHLLSDVDVDA